MGTKDAVLKFSQKELKKLKREQDKALGLTKKNKTPEKDLEKEVRAWAARNDVDLHVVESKNMYSAKSGRYTQRATSESMPDLCGNYGAISVWIELKAPGRRNTLKEHQKSFLERKIGMGCFACCIDSVKMLEKILFEWIDNRDKQYLLDQLP